MTIRTVDSIIQLSSEQESTKALASNIYPEFFVIFTIAVPRNFIEFSILDLLC